MEKEWRVAEKMSDEWAASFSQIHLIALQILWNRGLRTPREVDEFLHPDWGRDAHAPADFTQMSSAVARIFLAFERGEMITVHGDYDADGVCGSTVLMSTLRDIIRAKLAPPTPLEKGGSTSIFLPHREKDGYGLSVKTVDHLHEHEKTKLIITVDCGISNNEAIARAHELGMDVIVCDHHQMPETLPTHAILLHPLVPGETYPNKKLCGTGVAYKLACALVEEAHKRGLAITEGYEKWLLDLVAIATVTDMMPLLGENRVLEKFGLLVLNKTKRLGLKALLQAAGADGKELDTWSIGFQIGPRINAAGRMDHANAAFELLMCEDPLRVNELASTLNQSNIDRQKASEQLYQAAKKQIGLPGQRKILFAIGDGWSIGLAGLVAGKLMQDYQLPVFVICQKDTPPAQGGDGGGGSHYAGSGRSMHGFDVTAAMKNAASVLDRFGGHPQACGMSLTGEDHLEAFKTLMEAQARAYFENNDATPTLQLEAEVAPSLVTWELLEALKELEPYGEAHPRPLLKSPPVTIMGLELLGADKKHLRLTIREQQHPFFFKCIGFRMSEYFQTMHVGDMIEIVYEAGVNEWNGRKEIQLRLVDLHKL